MSMKRWLMIVVGNFGFITNQRLSNITFYVDQGYFKVSKFK